MWFNPLIGSALVMVLLEEIRIYITRYQNTVEQYIANRTIMNFCLESKRKPVMRLYR